MMSTLLAQAKAAVSLFRWLTWLARKLRITDFGIYLFLFLAIALISSIEAALQLKFVQDWLSEKRISMPADVWYVPSTILVASIVQFTYVLRLRRLGVVSVDSEIIKGTDYKAALNRVNDGFDFVGIGASKLTSNDTEFASALERIKSHGAVARFLLCDPRYPIVERLEKVADVSSGKYLHNVKQSFAFLERMKERFGTSIEVRVYQPDKEDDLITLRFMFVNKSLCLLSQNEVGKKSNEGRSASQLHIVGKSFFETHPTLYASFGKLFEQLWAADTTHPLTPDDFREIAELKAQ